MERILADFANPNTLTRTEGIMLHILKIFQQVIEDNDLCLTVSSKYDVLEVLIKVMNQFLRVTVHRDILLNLCGLILVILESSSLSKTVIKLFQKRQAFFSFFAKVFNVYFEDRETIQRAMMILGKATNDGKVSNQIVYSALCLHFMKSMDHYLKFQDIIFHGIIAFANLAEMSESSSDISSSLSNRSSLEVYLKLSKHYRRDRNIVLQLWGGIWTFLKKEETSTEFGKIHNACYELVDILKFFEKDQVISSKVCGVLWSLSNIRKNQDILSEDPDFFKVLIKLLEKNRSDEILVNRICGTFSMFAKRNGYRDKLKLLDIERKILACVECEWRRRLLQLLQ